jgi:hypothetical protein
VAEAAAPVACRLDAFEPEGRVQHGRLVAELLAAASDVTELSDGYAVRFPARPFLFLRIARWIEIERACCPFLTIRLEFERATPAYRVWLTGPEGTKDVLRAEVLRLPIGTSA